MQVTRLSILIAGVGRQLLSHDCDEETGDPYRKYGGDTKKYEEGGDNEYEGKTANNI